MSETNINQGTPDDEEEQLDQSQRQGEPEEGDYDDGYEQDEDIGDPQANNSLNASIKNLESLTDQDKLRYLKKRQKKQERYIQFLRDQNNRQRDELKTQAQMLEKLVDSNVKKQIAQENKLQGPYNYLGEQQILSQILDKKKTVDDFKDILDPAIINELIEIQQQLKKNNEVRQEIQSIKSKSKNLNHIEKIKNLQNELNLKLKQKNELEKNAERMLKLMSNQDKQLEELQKDYDYKAKLDSLNQEIKSEKSNLTKMQKEDQEFSKRLQAQQVVFSQLEEKYRDVSRRLGQFGNIMDLSNDAVQNYQAKRKKPQDEQEIKYKKRAEKIQYMPKENDKLTSALEQELLKKFKENKEVQKQTIIDIREFKEQMAQEEKKKKQQLSELQNKINVYDNELKELQKKLQEREHEAQIAISNYEKIKKIHNKHNKKQIVDTPYETVVNQKIVSLKEDFKRSIKNKLTKPRGKEYSRTAGGTFVETESQIIFDDSLALAWRNINPKLIEIIVIHNERGVIYGIQGIYKVKQQRLNESENIPEQIINGPINYLGDKDSENIKKTSIKIKDDDYLRFISGVFNEQIFYLRIETNLRERIEIGDMYLNDPNAQEFRLDFKQNQIPVSLIGIIDYTTLSKTSEERFLVALGVEVYLPQQSYLARNDDMIEEKIVVSEDDMSEDMRKRKIVAARKIKYKLKKPDNKSLLVMVNESKNFDSNDKHYEFMQRERLRQEKIQLDLSPHKSFKPNSYKSKQYHEEEKKRRELSLVREKKVQEYVEQSKSVKLLNVTNKKDLLKEPKKTSQNVQISPIPNRKK